MSRNVRSGWKSNADPSLLDRVAIKSQFESFFMLLVMPTFELQPGRCMVITSVPCDHNLSYLPLFEISHALFCSRLLIVFFCAFTYFGICCKIIDKIPCCLVSVLN